MIKSLKPKVIIPLWPGTNGHEELARMFERAGASSDIIPLQRFLSNRCKLYETDLIGLAGGFAWGDHFGAGRIAAIDLVEILSEQLSQVIENKIPIIGICNGWQILIEAGLLPGNGQIGVPTAVLDVNITARFEHWTYTEVHLHEPEGVDCIWTKGLNGQAMKVPVAHTEGRLVLADNVMRCNVIATYGSYKGKLSYPESPNGQPIAGISNPQGNIIGMMPHPERTANDGDKSNIPLAIFQAGVNAVK